MKRQKHSVRVLVAAGVLMVLTSCLSVGCNHSKQELPEVDLSVWSAPEDQELLHQLVDSFKKEYEDEAVFDITMSEEDETTCRDTVLGDPEAAADVYSFAGDQFRALRQGGALLEVTEHTEEIIAACGGEQTAAAESAMADGKLYAYPATADNGYFLYYNKSYYTDEDVQSMDRILQIAAEHGKKITMDFTSGWYIYSFFQGAGLSIELNEDEVTNSCNWNAVDTKYTGVQVAQAMLDIASHDGFQNATTEEFQQNLKKDTFIAGISGAWDAKAVEEAWGENYAAAKLPTYTLAGEQVQMHSFTGYKLLGVNAHTKQPKWAMRLAEWITNEKNQELRFEMRGAGPANIKAAASDKVHSDPAIAALGAQSEYGHIQNVADTFWTPAYLFGTVIGAKNPDGTDLQKLLDQLVEGVTASPDQVLEEGTTDELEEVTS